MITSSFDNLSPAIISPKVNENRIKVDVVIYTFSKEIEKRVTEEYDCEKIGSLHMVHSPTDIYLLRHNGRKYGFFKTWVGAPACVGTLEDVCGFFDCKKFVHFGSAGCLDKEIARGKIMVPTTAYRDEGTSYHYAHPSDYIDIPNAKIVEDFFAANNVPFVSGGTWTTDAFFRETKNNFERRKEDGCISVEMECSAIQAVCDFRGYDVYMFLTGADLLDAPEWDERKNGKDGEVKHSASFFDIALSLAEYVANM